MRSETGPAGVRRLVPSLEVPTFLVVGGAGYVVDVFTFNLLRDQTALADYHPTVSKVLAVAAAMVVTYLGNRMLTWRDRNSPDRGRQVALFVVFNVIGLAISLAALVVSHDLLGLTSRLADNISANVIGLGLGTAFRYWSYRRFVFTGPADNLESTPQVTSHTSTSEPAAPPPLVWDEPLDVRVVAGRGCAGHDLAPNDVEPLRDPRPKPTFDRVPAART